MDSNLVLDLFTNRVPWALYETVYNLDSPHTFDQWKHTLIKCQEKWMHMRGNLDSFWLQPNPPCSHYMPQSSNFACHHDTMDMSTDRACSWPAMARVTHAEEVLVGAQGQQLPFRVQGGVPLQITSRGSCFSCGQPGHFMCQCPNRRQVCNVCTHITEVNDNESNTYQAIHVACAITDTYTPQQKADEWQSKVAEEDNNVKDQVLQVLWRHEEGFQNALTLQPGWG